MYQLIENFINDAKEMDDDIFPFMANKDWKEGKPVYYSGPYWDDHEARELVYSIMKGKWLSSGEKVNKFERELKAGLSEDGMPITFAGVGQKKACKLFAKWYKTLLRCASKGRTDLVEKMLEGIIENKRDALSMYVENTK